MEKQEYDFLKLRIYRDLQAAYMRLVYGPEVKDYWGAPKWRKIQALKPAIEKFQSYTDAKLKEYTEQIMDLNVTEIPNVLPPQQLKNHRIRCGIIPNDSNMVIKNQVIKRVSTILAGKAMYDGQIACRTKQREEEGLISLDTPYTDFYLTTETYEAMKTLESKYAEPIALKHMLAYVKYVLPKRCYTGNWIRDTKKLEELLTALGYTSYEQLIGVDFKYIEVNDEIYRRLSEKYKLLLDKEREIQKEKEYISYQMSLIKNSSRLLGIEFRKEYDANHKTNNDDFDNRVYAKLNDLVGQIEDLNVTEIPDLLTATALRQLRAYYGVIPERFIYPRQIISARLSRLIDLKKFEVQLEILAEKTEKEGPVDLYTRISEFHLPRRVIDIFRKNGFKANGRTLGEFMDFYRQYVVNARSVGRLKTGDVINFINACGYDTKFSNMNAGKMEVEYSIKERTKNELTKTTQ